MLNTEKVAMSANLAQLIVMAVFLALRRWRRIASSIFN
jgi:hypothetical protein